MQGLEEGMGKCRVNGGAKGRTWEGSGWLRRWQ